MGEVHLTFDNGPHAEGTPRVLEALDKHSATATFFVLGQHLATEAGAELACAIRDAGHRLGNHSYSHRVPLGDDPGPEAVERELARTQRLIDAIWPGPKWFRPFGGGGAIGPHLLSAASVEWLRAHRQTCVLWTSVPGDWRDPVGWVDRALTDVDTTDHSVVVLHDVRPDAMRRLDDFLAAVKARGHRFSNRFPRRVLPIIDGVAMPGLTSYVRG